MDEKHLAKFFVDTVYAQSHCLMDYYQVWHDVTDITERGKLQRSADVSCPNSQRQSLRSQPRCNALSPLYCTVCILCVFIPFDTHLPNLAC